MNSNSLYIGIDIGTSGVRACAIDQHSTLLHTCKAALVPPLIEHHHITQDASLWWQATQDVLNQLFTHIDAQQVKAISVNGTSGTVLVCNAQGKPLAPALMYNDTSCRQQAMRISAIAPADNAAHGASSGLAKLLYLQAEFPQAKHFLHQADWIVGQLCGRFDISDANNALKTGYDPQQSCWPHWFEQLDINISRLPDVVAPGQIIASVNPAALSPLKLNSNCRIVSGTTDSIAAFIATGASQPGDAVTSLGSTLVLKIVSTRPVTSAEFGIYSHKLGDYWLAGGASNSGGAVLAHYFTSQQLAALTPLVKPDQPTRLNYYPLLQNGERFPLNDPNFAPRLLPEAGSDAEFFQGILEGISQIELDGYNKLQQLGAPYPTQVFSAGGGSENAPWTQIRQQRLGVKLRQTEYSEACYGSALLAMRGVVSDSKTR